MPALLDSWVPETLCQNLVPPSSTQKASPYIHILA
jgi:hypothetical protein